MQEDDPQMSSGSIVPHLDHCGTKITDRANNMNYYTSLSHFIIPRRTYGVQLKGSWVPRLT